MGDSRCVRCAVRTLHHREKAEIFVYLAFVLSQESKLMSKIHCISNVLTIDIWKNIQSSSIATFESLALRVLGSLQVTDLSAVSPRLIIINEFYL